MGFLRRLGFFVAIAALLCGCDKPASNASSGGGSVPAPAPLATLRFGYFANVTHAQAVLEVASGDMQNALGSTQLKIKVFNAGPELMQALGAGEIDIGYVGPGPVISSFAGAAFRRSGAA